MIFMFLRTKFLPVFILAVVGYVNLQSMKPGIINPAMKPGIINPGDYIKEKQKM